MANSCRAPERNARDSKEISTAWADSWRCYCWPLLAFANSTNTEPNTSRTWTDTWCVMPLSLSLYVRSESKGWLRLFVNWVINELALRISEMWNVKLSIFRNFKIANIKTTTDWLIKNWEWRTAICFKVYILDNVDNLSYIDYSFENLTFWY